MWNDSRKIVYRQLQAREQQHVAAVLLAAYEKRKATARNNRGGFWEFGQGVDSPTWHDAGGNSTRGVAPARPPSRSSLLARHPQAVSSCFLSAKPGNHQDDSHPRPRTARGSNPDSFGADGGRVFRCSPRTFVRHVKNGTILALDSFPPRAIRLPYPTFPTRKGQSQTNWTAKRPEDDHRLPEVDNRPLVATVRQPTIPWGLDSGTE